MNLVVEKLSGIVDALYNLSNTSDVEGEGDIAHLGRRASRIIIKALGANEFSAGIEKHLTDPYLVFRNNREDARKLIGFIQMASDEIELGQSSAGANDVSSNQSLPATDYSDKVFIVHGHNEIMKQNVARFVERIKLRPIILHEQANGGQTIIEKFVSNTDVGFALVLLSADDMGHSISVNPALAKQRARQNVVYELGFFTAKLGRKRVVALVEHSGQLELPSDISGVIYVPFDRPDGSWRVDVIKELISCGYSIDANHLV